MARPDGVISMARAPLAEELLEQLWASYPEPAELAGQGRLWTQLTARLIERALQAEMTYHLGFRKSEHGGPERSNWRNGTNGKRLKTTLGEVELSVPRDREGTFAPRLVKKRQTRCSDFGERILALYARGSGLADLSAQLAALYASEVPADLLSQVTAAVEEEVASWQRRPLAAVYSIVYFDALVIRGQVQRAFGGQVIYFGLGVTLAGERELLGLWIGDRSGCWADRVRELEARGVRELLIACCGGPVVFAEAVEAVFPRALIRSRRVAHSRSQGVDREDGPPGGLAGGGEASIALAALAQEWGRRFPMFRSSGGNGHELQNSHARREMSA